MNATIEDLLADLTQPSIHTIERETIRNGRRTGTRPEYVTAPPLLDQLKEAIFQGMETGNGSANKNRLPLAANALDIWNEIEQEAAALHVGLASHINSQGKQIGLLASFWDYPHGDDQPGGPSDLTGEAVTLFTTQHPRPAPYGLDATIKAWTESIYTDVQAHTAERILRRWCSRIRNLLKPEPSIPIVGTCPRCDTERVLDRGKQRTALYATFAPDGGPEARCRNCGETWTGEHRLREIGFHIGATLDEDALKAMGVVA